MGFHFGDSRTQAMDQTHFVIRLPDRHQLLPVSLKVSNVFFWARYNCRFGQFPWQAANRL